MSYNSKATRLEEEILRLYPILKSVPAVSREVGINQRAVRDITVKAGIYVNQTRQKMDEAANRREAMIAMRTEGATYDKIGQAFGGISRQRVHELIGRHEEKAKDSNVVRSKADTVQSVPLGEGEAGPDQKGAKTPSKKGGR